MLRRLGAPALLVAVALLPVPAGAASDAPPRSSEVKQVANVVYAPQTHALSCEAAALQMALSHEGVNAGQDDILALIPVDSRPPESDDDGFHWGNPFTSFVGDVDGSEVDDSGYGTYFPTIAAAATQLGGTVLRAGQGVDPYYVYDAVAAGHPVVAWISYDYAYHERQDYTSFDGAIVPYAGPVEHAVTLVAVREDYVLVYDPDAGPLWIYQPDFAATYETFGEMAVVLA